MIKPMNKKGVIHPLVLAIGFIASLLTILSISGIINIQGAVAELTGTSSGEYIQVPYIPFLKCDLSGTTRDYTRTISGTGGQWLELPDNTNGYSIKLMSEKLTTFETMRRFEYYICPQESITTNCIRKVTDWKAGDFYINLGTLADGRYVWAEYQGVYWLSYRARSGASYQITYQPYTLQRTDLLRGSGEILGSEGCYVPYTEWNERLISSFKDKVPSDGDRTLQPNEIFNYFSGTITRMALGNIENGKYCVYSNGVATLYPIIPLKTAIATYNVVDVNSPSGTQACCSGDNIPDKTCVNGKWVSTLNEECSFLNPCEGNDWRPNYGIDKQVVRYECVSSKCVLKTKAVDCNKDSDCASTNLRCNPTTFKCEVASIGVDDAGTQVLATSELDCLNQGNKWIPKTTTRTGLLWGIIPFGGTTEVVEAHCEPQTIKWLLWIAIGFIVVAFFLFSSRLMAGIRMLLSKIGIRI